MEQMPILRRTVKPEDLPKIYKRAFERELDRNIMAQLSEPGRVDDHRAFSANYARYFSLLAEKPHLLDGSIESFEELRLLGLSTADADAISVLAHTHRHQPPVSAGYLADDLRAVGVEPSHNNMKATARLTATAYREANIAAWEELGMPMNPGEIWPLPPHFQKFADQVARHQQPALPTSSPTFAPCFMWIFAFAPWIDTLGNAVRLKGGLAAVTAAVVGVIANLTAWFALHVLFAEVGQRNFGPLRLYWPDPANFDWRSGLLAVLACVLAFGPKWSVLRILAACAAGGLALSLPL